MADNGFENVTPLRPVATPYRSPDASPAAFGGQIGGALQQAGQEAGAIAHNKRLMDAGFDAQDRELRFGQENDKLEQDFKNDVLAGLTPADGQSYTDAINARVAKLAAARTELRAQHEGALKDPIAQKMYETRTRLQTQMAERQARIFADTHVRERAAQASHGVIQTSVDRAGNVVGVPEVDVQNFTAQTGLAHHAWDLANPGAPKEAAEAGYLGIDKQAAHRALTAYGENYQAGEAFLASKTTDGMRISFDPKHPDEPAILNAAEVAKWRGTFTEAKAQKAGAGMGLLWMLKGVKNPRAEAQHFLDEHKDDPSAAAQAMKAITEYTSLTAATYSAQQHAEAQTYKSAYETVAAKFDRDVDAADRSGALPGVSMMQKDELRALFLKRDDSPEFQRGRAMFGDAIVSGPGWSEHWKSEADLAADWLPKVGPRHFEEVRRQWESDQRRPKEQDARTSSETAFLEDRLRVALDWQDDGSPERRHWSAADPWQMNLHEWAVTQWNEGLNRHREEIKAGKASDADWAKKLRNQIMQQILHDRKRADKNTPLPVNLFTPRSRPPLPANVKAYLTAKDKGAGPDFPDTPAGEEKMRAWLSTPEGQAWSDQGAE